MTASSTQPCTRVLIVEDHLPSQRTLARLMRLENFHVHCVSTVAEGKAALSAVIPDLMILDLMLPDGSGADILSDIRKRELQITVAIVTAASEQMLSEDAKLQPDALFRKPIDVHQFMQWASDQRNARELECRPII